MQEGFRRDTRSINFTDSSLLQNPAGEVAERSPLLGSRHASRSFQLSSRTQSVSSYQFDLEKEKKRCKKLFHDRVPKGKAPFIVFLINFLESFAFHGALSFIWFVVFSEPTHGNNKDKSELTFEIFYFTTGRLFYPVAGLIADVYLGRYKIIHIGLWLLWVGFAVIMLGMAFVWKYPQYSLIPGIVATILFMLGSASVESTIIPFGVDQIRQGAPSEELSSYFSWYYFGRNAGYLANVLCLMVIGSLQTTINGWIQVSDITCQVHNSLDCPDYLNNDTFKHVENLEDTITNAVLGVILLMAVTVAVSLLHCNQRLFFRARQLENPLRTIINVLYFAATVKRQAPRHRRSFRYGEERKPRIELAKVEFDGIYSSEEVEDVKTFLRLLFFTLSLGLCFAIFGALDGKYARLTTDKSGIPIYFSLVENGLLVILIPIFNHFFLPCVPGASMKLRVGIGILFFLLSAALGTVAQWKVYERDPMGSNHIQLLWITAPVVLFTIGDMFLFISGLEFIYAQSPSNMKGLLTGIFYFVFGAFNGVGAAIFYSTLSSAWWHFYVVVLVVSLAGLVLYIMVTLCYRNRERPTNDESEKEILHRSYAASVYLS